MDEDDFFNEDQIFDDMDSHSLTWYLKVVFSAIEITKKVLEIFWTFYISSSSREGDNVLHSWLRHICHHANCKRYEFCLKSWSIDSFPRQISVLSVACRHARKKDGDRGLSFDLIDE
jgi:hypothetical protein